MRVLLFNDHGGVVLRNSVLRILESLKIDVDDMGSDSEEAVDYPDVALHATKKFLDGGYNFGILICGTGIGMSIAANKVKGIRCALIWDILTARMAKIHNDANFIALGGRVKYPESISDIIEAYVSEEFGKAHHSLRVGKILDMEKE